MFSPTSERGWQCIAVALVSTVLVQPGSAAPKYARSEFVFSDNDPFAVLDPQHWVNPANMTWDDVCAVSSSTPSFVLAEHQVISN